MIEIARRKPEGTIYRLGRRESGAWRFPDWLHADVNAGTFGSRYDDPDSEYRVLYACSNRACAFIEVLWYHTADAQLATDIADIVENDDSDAVHTTVEPGHLDIGAWCAERSIGTAAVAPERAFASTTDPITVHRRRRNRVRRHSPLSRRDEAVDNWALFELEPTDPPAPWLVVENGHETSVATDDADLLAAIERHRIVVI